MKKSGVLEEMLDCDVFIAIFEAIVRKIREKRG